MDEFKKGLAQGVFDPPAVKDLTDAFGKAEEHIQRLAAGSVVDLDSEKVACHIIAEARDGETQPDLVWRTAVAKALLATQNDTSKVEKKRDRKSPGKGGRRRPQRRVEPTDMPPAGPHAAAEHTNESATPGNGALPSPQPGDGVDPGLG